MTITFNNRAFREPDLVHHLRQQIAHIASPLAERQGRPIKIMEVCGGHTHTLFHYGIHQLIGEHIEFVHGPGCPVCVLPCDAIDRAATLASRPASTLVTFGDVLRVPGSHGSLEQIKARGADIRVVYSPLDVLTLARNEPERQVVLFAIGFDTTMPSIAMTIEQAKRQQLNNLTFLCYHIRLIPTLATLLDNNALELDGFIGPGHVSMVLGRNAYRSLTTQYQKPMVIAGFEPVDILQAVLMLLRQLNAGRCDVENAYTRVVSDTGNTLAQQAIHRVFRDSTLTWKGVGAIPNSICALHADYADFDAGNQVAVAEPSPCDEPAYCSQVLLGNRKPTQCPWFATHCRPASPMGSLMVSSEGACAAYYKYQTIPVSADAAGHA